ncbi:MAG: NUDIX hydrolase [Solirubrobacteraceae bacterium]
MSADRPEPGVEFSTGAVTVPRLAATVILLRGGDSELEVLLAQRTPKARFMGGAWVFPGGAVSEQDGAGDAGLRAAAARELREEAGIDLADPDELVAFSRWITPAVVKIRYDTSFFLAIVPEGAEPVVDGEEMVDARWYAPAAALQAARDGRILLVFPTIKNLEQLATFGSADELVNYARSNTIAPVEPRVVGEGETARLVLPGEPGYSG